MRIASHYRLWLTTTLATIVVAALSLAVFGLNLGLDFTGGSLMDVSFTQPVTQEAVSKAVTGKNELGGVTVTPVSDTQYLLRFQYLDSENGAAQVSELLRPVGSFVVNEFTTIGPSVGASLLQKALRALTYACIAIVLYLAATFRDRKSDSGTRYYLVGGVVALIALVSEFMLQSAAGVWGTFAAAALFFLVFLALEIQNRSENLKYGLAAILALLHDVLIILGVFAVLGYFFGFEFDTLVITALLIILGYSVNDTIVVFDRLREQLKFQKAGETYTDVANRAVNQTIGRSISSSVTVVLAVLALMLFGAESIRHFMMALLIGVVAGTWSSIFVATPLLVVWQKLLKHEG